MKSRTDSELKKQGGGETDKAFQKEDKRLTESGMTRLIDSKNPLAAYEKKDNPQASHSQKVKSQQTMQVSKPSLQKKPSFFLNPHEGFRKLVMEARFLASLGGSLALVNPLLEEMEKTPADISLHLQTLTIVIDLLNDPTDINIKSCQTYAEKSAYKGSTKNFIKGCLLGLIGGLIITAASTLVALTLVLSAGAASPWTFLAGGFALGLALSFLETGITSAIAARQRAVYLPLITLFKEISNKPIDLEEEESTQSFSLD